MLEFVQHSGCLDVPGTAACALARGKNEGGVPFVLDPHDITLQDDLWHAAFAGNVDIVAAPAGPQHRNANICAPANKAIAHDIERRTSLTRPSWRSRTNSRYTA